LIDAPDAAAKSRTVFAYDEGLLTQARIQNDLEVLREAERGMRELLGVKETKSAVVESDSSVLHTN
jgi:TetR/AcrR family transcriptional repressor of nem operon